MKSSILYFFTLLIITILFDACKSKIQDSNNNVNEVKRLEFWSSLLKDDSLLLDNEDKLDQEMSNYIFYLEKLDSTRIVNSIQDAIHHLGSSSNLYKFWDKINHYSYHPNSPVRNDELSLILFQELVKIKDIKESYEVRYNHIIRLLKKNRPGSFANDFNFIDKSGSIQSLYDIKSPLLLVIFYDPNCHTCYDVIKKLESSELLSNLIIKEKINVLTVNLLNEDIQKSLIHNMPISWMSGSNVNQTIINKELYNILAYPTIYILDHKKRVILKDADLNQTLLYLNSII